MKKLLALGSLTFALFGIVSVASADHSWNGYHWARTQNPFTLRLGDNVSGAWDSYVRQTSADWSASSVLDTAVVAGATTGRACKASLGSIQVCNYGYGKTGWLGIAQVWISSGHITQATAKMNDTYFNTAKYNTPAWKRLVMCQEVAHAFGLDHQDEAFGNRNVGSCMDYTNAPAGGVVGGIDYGPSNERPNAHDFSQLESIYAHLDGKSTAAGSPASARGRARTPGIEGESSAEWGRALRQDRAGRDSVFVRDLGAGEQVITHIFWLPEESEGHDTHDHAH